MGYAIFNNIKLFREIIKENSFSEIIKNKNKSLPMFLVACIFLVINIDILMDIFSG